MNKLTWNPRNSSTEINNFMALLSEDYPLVPSGGGLELRFVRVKEAGLRVEKKDFGYEITYSVLSEAGRAVGAVLAGLADAAPVKEYSPMTSIGVMFDCSRNSVMTVERSKYWMRRLALLGFNWVMFYTKDAYELPGEDFFGYLRGRYTLEEFRAMDDYAAQLGIRVTGNIQTLAHLEPVLRWPAYGEMRDTASVMMVDCEKSYRLIGKMLDFYSSAFRDRRLHIGMDEAWDLGRGAYLTLHGYQDPADLFFKHIGKVSEMCRERGIRPMVWSDMFLRPRAKHGHGDYYDPEMKIEESAHLSRPDNVDLVYWDYYHTDEQFYRKWINHHKKLGVTPIMASSVWISKCFWYKHELSKITFTPCIRACIREKVREIFFCMWEDDGGYCDRDSAQAGLAYAAELIYGQGNEVEEDKLALRFTAACKADYRLQVAASAINTPLKFETNTSDFLWDDPLLGICWKYWWNRDPEILVDLQSKFAVLAEKLNAAVPGDAGDIEHLAAVATALSAKIDAQLKLYTGYFGKFRKVKIEDVLVATRASLSAMEALLESYRRHWYKGSKTFGFEVMQIRLGGQCARHKELIMRLEELRDGTIVSIPELEQQTKEFPASYGKNEEYYKPSCTWRHLATPAFDF